MKILVFDSVQEASEYAYNHFKEKLQQGARVFGLATGSSPEKLYSLLSESDLDFSDSISINLDEYYGLAPDNEQSYAYFMQKHLFDHKPFKHSYLPNGLCSDINQEIQYYEEIIEKNPVDLQILGLGPNGHVGFNEPGSSFASTTRLVALTPETIQANRRFFESEADVPREAITMGISSIMKAKEIILLAFGNSKAEAIQQAIEGPVTEALPASVLQTHPNVTILLDPEAATGLSATNYQRIKQN